MHLLYLVYFVNTSCLLFFALTYGCINTAHGVWAPLVGVGQLNNSPWWLQMPWCKLDTKPSATATLTPQWTQCNTNHVSQHASRVKLKWKFFVSSWIGSCRFDNLRRQWQQWCLRVQPMTKILTKYAGIILCMRPANERRRYKVTSSLIGWVHTKNDLWI